MSHLVISKKNEVYLLIEAEPHIYYELRDEFQFEVPGAKFSPAYRNKYWDGRIYLFNVQNGEIYIGLLDKILLFCKNYNYTYEFKNNKFYGLPAETNTLISREGVKDYITKISKHPPRNYQIDGVYDALFNNRKLLISPTASGKSLMIYSIIRYYVEHDLKCLVIFPTTSLVHQMYKDFEDYGWDSSKYCHKICAGENKDTDLPITLSTWQSIYKLDRKYFSQFDVVVGDECHTFKAKSLMAIMTKLDDAKYRFGFTGTLDGTQTHKWVLEGLFGSSYKTISTSDLMNRGHIAELKINMIILKHTPVKFETYEDEIQHIINHSKRNSFIKNLSLSLNGNTLILYSRVETHGKLLYDLINSSTKLNNRKVFFIHGGVEVEEREQTRKIIESETDAIVVASYGTYSTGINMPNLKNIIFASPSKSRIRNLQSIGRGLRKFTGKDCAELYDISDDITYNNRKNYTLNHMLERIKIYSEENFNYTIKTIPLD
jgi:superfamily II DNA or RNA helicase